MTLSRFRRVVAAYIAIYLVVRAPVFWSLGSDAPGRFNPVGPLGWLDSPLGSEIVFAAWAVTLVTAIALAADWEPHLIGPVFAIATLLLFTYRSSFGQILWFEHLPVLHALIVGFTVRSTDSDSDKAREDWPLRLAAIVTVTTYVLAGIAKLRIGGIGWVTDGSLANHIAFSAARLRVLGGTPSPLASPLLALGPVLTIAGAAALAIELAAPLALLRRVRTAWIIGAWVMHAAIAASMFVVFPYPLFGVAFAPLLRHKLSQTRTT